MGTTKETPAQPEKSNPCSTSRSGLPLTSRAKNKKFNAGSSRGIETMLRSLYRTHLDLTTLADNKASIMITINGLIISILLATGGSVVAFADNNLYILPIIVLLVSGFVSMIYAVISARPIAERCCDAVKVPDDFINGRANVMYFMDNADLSNDEYVMVMKEVMADKERVYDGMVSYIHTMSMIIRRKFFLLRMAYFIFIVGLGLCIATFIGVAGIIMLKTEKPNIVTQMLAEPAKFSRFSTSSEIFEPSGVHQLGDGRILVVEDEASHPFSLLTIHPDGGVESTHLMPNEMFAKNGPYQQFRKLDDLEGLDVDNRGYIYTVTSHSPAGGNGRYDENRGKLSRFRISGEQILEPVVVTGLRKELTHLFPELEQETAGKGFNIEGLALNPRQDELLLGFRSPVDKNGRAIIAVIDNLDALFSGNSPIHFAPSLIRLNLNGSAIRGISYDPRLQGYLIVGGPSRKGSGKQNQLWFWNGVPDSSPRLVIVKGLGGIKNAEGVSPVLVNGERRILIVSDDGNRKSSKNAGFLLFDYEQLQIM